MGKYNNDPTSLPKREMAPESHKIKKIDNLVILIVVMSFVSILLLYILGIFLINHFGRELLCIPSVIAVVVSVLFNIPHEYIHAICFKEEAYIYITNGAFFAMSPEHMTKRRYLIMLMLPFLVLGIIPLCIGLVLRYSPLAVFGVMSIIPCTGDLYMAISALFQVPKNGKIYLYDMVNYWYV
jgi:hypothetical protein